ncbi:MAG: hypothetical protein QOK05_1022 [Chloroflexota bacterium]|nr:hypothetical protein [Chloroflexota bacterium]
MIALNLNTRPARRALAPDTRTRVRPAVRARRAAGTPLYRWVILLGILVAIFAIAFVAETAQATQASYQIGQLNAEHNRLLAQQGQIQMEISRASSAVSFDGDAGKLGLVRSSQWQYLPGGQSPVALARQEPAAPAQANPSFFDRLAVALGRPTEAQAKGR